MDQKGQFRLTKKEFQLLSSFIQKNLGIKKKGLVNRYLSKRLLTLGRIDLVQYYQILIQKKTEELQLLLNVVNNNTTTFYREPHQLEFIQKEVLPFISHQTVSNKKLRIWSTGCSTGAEPYTIAILFLKNFGTHTGSWNLRILASDVNTQALEKAQAGVYTFREIHKVPKNIRAHYFVQKLKKDETIYQVIPQLKKMIQFRPINLMDSRYPVNTLFHFIVCRNVLIYFEKKMRFSFYEGSMICYMREDIFVWDILNIYKI